MMSWICSSGRWWTINMRARACPSNHQHDGGERRRRGHGTIRCALLLPVGCIEKPRPARGAVRDNWTHHRHAQIKKLMQRRICQIASSYIPLLNSVKEECKGNASLRLRSDSNLNRIGTPQGGGSQSVSQIALSTWPQPLASQSEREVGASPRLPVRPGPQPLHHLTKWAGGKIKAIKRATFSAKWPRTSMSTGRARCARNKRATCIVHQWSHIRRYVVQVSCLGLYCAKFHSTSRRLSEHCLKMLSFSLMRTCISSRQRTRSACSSKNSIDHNRVSPVKQMAVNSLCIRVFWSADAVKVTSCCASSSSRKSVIRLEYTNPLAHLFEDQKHHCNEFSCLRVHHLHGLHTSPKCRRGRSMRLWATIRSLHESAIFAPSFTVFVHHHDVTWWQAVLFSVEPVSSWPVNSVRFHFQMTWWPLPSVRHATREACSGFILSFSVHHYCFLSTFTFRNTHHEHHVMAFWKNNCTGSKSSSVHSCFSLLISCSPSVNRRNTSTP